MRTFKQRWWSRFALAAGLGVVQLVACSSDHPQGFGDAQRTGSVALALEATAASGTSYRLRNAIFTVTDIHSGRVVDTLFSEEAPPQARELTRILATGNYTVKLEDGWFLERVGGSGGGSGGTAGDSSTGGVGGSVIGTGGSGAKGGTSSGGRGGRGSAAASSTGGSTSVGGSSTSVGGSTSMGGDPGSAGSGEVDGEDEAVEAFLLSDAVQFFSLFGGDEAFVTYLFQVGGEVIDFNRGKLHVGIEVIEDPSVCQPPEGALDPQRVLLESNVDAVSNISIFDVFGALASNGGLSADADLLFREIYESYASAGNASIEDAIHCGDETTDGSPSLNGYPITCDRVETFHRDDEFGFFATAFVNRMDLAPENGAHCGQQRVVFASRSLNRAFMIVEAQIPNPHPEMGIEGCVPLAQFWLEQNEIDDANERGFRLAQAFIIGDPGLLEAGFGPFYTATNLTVGSGQIRTNQFDQDPWTLREFKLALDGENLKAVPFPTSESPNGALWNENVDLAQGPACRQSFLDASDQLLTNDLSQLSFVVDQACKDAESRNDFSEDYSGQMSDGLRQALDERLAGTGLDAFDLANRAQFAGSCIGCHNEANGRFLGNNMFAPFSNDFTHVSEFTVACGPNKPGDCFQTSPALRDAFLPGRLQVMGQILGIPIIEDPCDGSGGTGGTGGVGGAAGSTGFGGTAGSFGFGGSFAGDFSVGGEDSGSGAVAGTGASTGGRMGTAGRSGMGTGGRSSGSAGRGTAGSAPAGTEPGEPLPAPEVDTPLPPASEPVDEMQENDDEIRELYGERTLSGRSAKSTH